MSKENPLARCPRCAGEVQLGDQASGAVVVCACGLSLSVAGPKPFARKKVREEWNTFAQAEQQRRNSLRALLLGLRSSIDRLLTQV